MHRRAQPRGQLWTPLSGATVATATPGPGPWQAGWSKRPLLGGQATKVGHVNTQGDRRDERARRPGGKAAAVASGAGCDYEWRQELPAAVKKQGDDEVTDDATAWSAGVAIGPRSLTCTCSLSLCAIFLRNKEDCGKAATLVLPREHGSPRPVEGGQPRGAPGGV